MFAQQYSVTSRPSSRLGNESSAPAPRMTRERSTSSSELKDHYTKRSSIFSKRPKSILTTSSRDSSTRSHASISSSSDVSWRSLAGDANADSESTRSRFLFGRSRKVKNSSTRSFRAPSPVDADDESDYRQDALDRPRGTPGKGVRISAPFGFQHVTKMEGPPAAIKEESDEVFENFRSLRKGHRHGVFASSVDEDESEVANINRQRRPPPLRPQRPDDLWGDLPGSAPLPYPQQRLRSSSLVDSPQQPRSADPLGYRGIPLDRRSPPRASPGLAQAFKYGPGPAIDTETGMRTLDSFDDEDSYIPLYDAQPPGWIETSVPLLHTVSPIDTLPDYVRAPIFSQPLEKVLEEPEGTLSNRPSRDLPRRPSLRHSKSSPAVASRYKASIQPFSEEAPPLPPFAKRLERTLSQCSQGSDTLGNPLQSLWHESKSCTNLEDIVKAEQARENELTWEDDIDYCYEHNAEADCEYDWQDISHYDDNDSDDLQSWNGPQSSSNSPLRPKRQESQPGAGIINSDSFPHPNNSYRVPSNSSVPDLDYRHSHSASTTSLSIATPRDGSLYRGSDALPHFDIMQIQAGKDSMSPRCTTNELQRAPGHLYNEIMVARNVDSATPEIPSHSEDRPQTVLYTAPIFSERYLGALPTPPLSSKYTPGTSEGGIESKGASGVPTNDQDIKAAQMTPLPASPLRSDIGNDDEVPQLVSRSFVGVQNAAKLRLLEAQTRLHNLAPASIPRSGSSESLNTGIQYTKLPSPPTTPSLADTANFRSFLSTPSPGLPPVPSPASQTPRNPSPSSLGPLPTFLPPLDQPRSVPSRSNPNPLARHRAESAAARLGVLPSPSASFIEKPGTPDSAVSMSTGSSHGRMSYSLFPSRAPPVPLDVRTPLNAVPGAAAPTSAPMVTPMVPPMPMDPPKQAVTSEPPTRPVSRATSLATSLASSRGSSSASTRTTSRSEPRSVKGSKSTKKANTYQERYPLGI